MPWDQKGEGSRGEDSGHLNERNRRGLLEEPVGGTGIGKGERRKRGNGSVAWEAVRA